MALTTQFLSTVCSAVRAQDAEKLGLLLRVEPPVEEVYFGMSRELQVQFKQDSKVLDALVAKSLPLDHDGSEGQGTPWPGFVAFMMEYLAYWRDADFEDLIATHRRLSSLVT